MNKHTLIQAILSQLNVELTHALEAAEEAHKGATHDQSKAETQYDTLGLEHAYLAEGQAKRIASLKEHIILLNKMSVKNLTEDDPIYLGAIVHLTNLQTQQTLTVFIASCAGGTHVHHDGLEIHVISSNSPLTQALLGLYTGDICKLESGAEFEITQVI